MFEVCPDCPYGDRCKNMERCIQGRNAATVVLPEPKSVPVQTTSGIGMTGKTRGRKKK